MNNYELQKEYEKLSIRLNEEKGATAYYQGLCGTYRRDNHKNFMKAKKLSIVVKILSGVIVITNIIYLVIILGA